MSRFALSAPLAARCLTAWRASRPDLPAAYRDIGGSDPAVQQIMNDMNGQFAKINFTNAKVVAARAANGPNVAKAKADSVVAGNPVFTVNNTALNSLAQLGGEDFAQTYGLNITRQIDLGK